MQFSRRLPEPSQTPCTRVLEPFWLQFGFIFGAVWASFSETHGKVKIVLLLIRELNFQGPGPSEKLQENDFFQKTSSGRVLEPSLDHFFSSRLHFGSLWVPRWAPKTPLKNTLKKDTNKTPQSTQEKTCLSKEREARPIFLERWDRCLHLLANALLCLPCLKFASGLASS